MAGSGYGDELQIGVFEGLPENKLAYQGSKSAVARSKLMKGLSIEEARKQIQVLLERAIPPEAWMPEGTNLVIYGAGNCGREVLRMLRRRGFSIEGVLDKRGGEIRQVDGVECVAPESTLALRWASRGLPVVLAIFNSGVDLGEVYEHLRVMGFTSIISYYDLFERFSGELSSQYWLGPRDIYAKHADDILRSLELWSDDFSRWLYTEQLRLRMTFDLQLLRQPDHEHQYFPVDLPVPWQGIRLIDGGAFIGDTLQAFIENGFSFDALAAFEPDLVNFRALKGFVDEHRNDLRDTVLFPCGLGERTEHSFLAEGNQAASRISPAGNSPVQVVAIDDVLPTFAPTMIKLDVEGAEPSALVGAQETIYRVGPQLAVCVYHAPEHLWVIPKLLRDLRSDYRLALRYHQFNGFDAVAYAYLE